MEVERCMIHKASHPQERCFLLQHSTAACSRLHQTPFFFFSLCKRTEMWPFTDRCFIIFPDVFNCVHLWGGRWWSKESEASKIRPEVMAQELKIKADWETECGEARESVQVSSVVVWDFPARRLIEVKRLLIRGSQQSADALLSLRYGSAEQKSLLLHSAQDYWCLT